MLMYRCSDCGHVFEKGEEQRFEESRGEFWGFPAYEQMSGCPICGEAYYEVKPCKICGSYEHEEDENFCEKCKIETAKKFKDILISHFTSEELEYLREEAEMLCD